MSTGNPYLDSVIAGFHAQQKLMQQHINALTAKLDQLQAGGPPQGEEIRWPEVFRAGVIKYPKKDPFPYFHVIELTPTEADVAFGETTAIATGSVSVDRSAETFLCRISAHMYQYEAQQQEAPPYVLNRWRPVASRKFCKPDADECESLMDFRWNLKYGDEDVAMNQDWLPSDILENTEDQPGLLLTIEKEITQYEIINLQAQPLAGAGDGNKWRLFFVLHTYKMLPRVTA
jgi:hypothetical protein